MRAKYKEYFLEMIEKNRDVFEPFKDLHDKYEKEPQKYQTQFNQEGKKILEIVQEWENRLCSASEKGGYARFSTNLSEKFRNAVRSYLPKFDSIGLEY